MFPIPKYQWNVIYEAWVVNFVLKQFGFYFWFVLEVVMLVAEELICGKGL